MHDVDSKVVNAAIRSEIRPVLRDQGFSRFTARTAWRFSVGRVEVVNFQSFNSYNASVIGCTTHSFSVNLGSYLTTVPDFWRQVKRHGTLLLPQEYQCHLRSHLFRSLHQPELPRRDIWYIGSQGQYLSEAVQDVKGAILSRGVAWFHHLRDDAEVLRILKGHAESDDLWGFGNNPSPMRSLLSGYVGLSVGEHDFAKASLRAAAESPSFSSVRKELEAAILAAG